MSLSPQEPNDIDMPAVHEAVEQPADTTSEQDEEMEDLFGEENEQNVVKPDRSVRPGVHRTHPLTRRHKGKRLLQMQQRQSQMQSSVIGRPWSILNRMKTQILSWSSTPRLMLPFQISPCRRARTGRYVPSHMPLSSSYRKKIRTG